MKMETEMELELTAQEKLDEFSKIPYDKRPSWFRVIERRQYKHDMFWGSNFCQPLRHQEQNEINDYACKKLGIKNILMCTESFIGAVHGK